MPDRFPIFDVTLKKRRRKWMWAVGRADGVPVMLGTENSRSAASYRANSALFMLLLASQRSRYPRTGAEVRVRR
jgi:hypothetical protein